MCAPRLAARFSATAHDCFRCRMSGVGSGRRRLEPAGSDRHGTLYWLLDGVVWACNDKWIRPRVHSSSTNSANSPSSSSPRSSNPASSAAEASAGTGAGCSTGSGGGGGESAWRCYTQGGSLERLLGFLNPEGPRERLLLHALDVCNVSKTAPQREVANSV
jgi:hypothetical protein